MQTILKYELTSRSNTFNFPVGSEILSVGVDGKGRLSMWVAVNDEVDAVCLTRHVYLYSTEDTIDESISKKFLGTIVDGTKENTYIWHAYLIGETK